MEKASLSPSPVETPARQKPSGTKRIKISRACDECRKRKVRNVVPVVAVLYAQPTRMLNMELGRLNVMVLNPVIDAESQIPYVCLQR